MPARGILMEACKKCGQAEVCRAQWQEVVPAAIVEDPKLEELRCSLNKLKCTWTELHVHLHGVPSGGH